MFRSVRSVTKDWEYHVNLIEKQKQKYNNTPPPLSRLHLRKWENILNDAREFLAKSKEDEKIDSNTYISRSQHLTNETKVYNHVNKMYYAPARDRVSPSGGRVGEMRPHVFLTKES